MTAHRSHIIHGTTITLAALFTSACVTTTIQEVRQAETGLEAHESVVVLGRHHKGGEDIEGDFVECVAGNLNGGKSKLAVIGEDAFVDALFPWFEPRTAPLDTSDLPEIISHPLLSEKLDSIGVRYVIWVEGGTQRTDGGGSLACAAGPTGAACFGFLTWEDDSFYEAAIWDIKNGAQVGKVSSDATGVSYMPAVIVPVPFLARVQNSACNSLADQLERFITNES